MWGNRIIAVSSSGRRAGVQQVTISHSDSTAGCIGSLAAVTSLAFPEYSRNEESNERRECREKRMAVLKRMAEKRNHYGVRCNCGRRPLLLQRSGVAMGTATIEMPAG